MKRQSGITVVEILVGLALSLIILAGVMHILINNKQTYRVQEAFARLQENGRFAMNFIIKDLRMAGFIGCAGKLTSAPINNANYYPHPKTGPDTDPDEVGEFNASGIEGFEHSEVHSDLPIVLTETVSLTAANAVLNSDIVRIKRASSTGIRVKEFATPGSAGEIKLALPEAQDQFQQYDTLFVSDCEAAHVFVATNVSETPNPAPGWVTLSIGASNMNPGLNHDYGSDAEVFKLINSIYYVGINSHGETALYRQSLGNANTMVSEELVEGVESMKLYYGEDKDDNGTPNVYVKSSEVGNWDDIVSVRIELQVRSTEDNVTARTDEDEGDRRLRRTFITSIALRNQVI